jgi:L-alanine-DL-glutamate epimerase-like enolase superfamily enzyme
VLKKPRLTKLDDMRHLGQEAVKRGYKAVKTNPVIFEATGPRLLNPGFIARNLRFRRIIDERTLHAIADQLDALRDGLGPEAGLMLDLNFRFRPAALRRIVSVIGSASPAWLEVDVHDPAALNDLRTCSPIPIASLESIHGRRGYKAYFLANAVDVAIVDVPWNGLCEAVRIASMAEAFEVNVAPHNYYGPLADLMSAHFCAAVGNVAIMEFEGDDVPWKSSLLTAAPVIDDGQFAIPSGPGWGADISEEAVNSHPWSGDSR